MKYSFVAAALVGAVLATPHNAHRAFHARRGGYEAKPADVCSVYTTTVYVTAPEAAASTSVPVIPAYSPVAPSSSPEAAVYPPAPAPASSTSCTEELAAHSTAPAPASPAVPEASKEAYPAAPKPEIPAPKPVVPVESKQVYPTAPAPASSTSCTEEQAAHPTAPAPASPAVPEASKEAYPAAPKPEAPVSQQAYPTAPAPAPTPASSTSCTEEQAAHSTAAAPVIPAVPAAPKPEAPVSKPSYPAAPKPEAPVSKPSYPAAPKPEAPVSQPPYSAAPKPQVPVSQPASSAQASPTKSAEQSVSTGSYSSSSHIKTNGDKWAITYTPYATNGQCKGQDEVKDDIKKISELGFTTIRSYSTDCGVFENVVPECQKHGLKVIYGIFLEAGGKGTFSQHAEDQLNAIKDKAPKDSVAMVIVGNECMSNNNCQPAELASYIDHVRNVLRGAGFPQDIAITTTETVGTWEQKGAALCDHIDVFAVQVQPYFTQSISPDQAGDFAAEQLEQAAKVCPGPASKGKFISEIGWPSAGSANGKAVAGVSEQKTAMQKIQEKVGAKACLFSYQNDEWKPPGVFNVEQNFGILKALF